MQLNIYINIFLALFDRRGLRVSQQGKQRKLRASRRSRAGERDPEILKKIIRPVAKETRKPM